MILNFRAALAAGLFLLIGLGGAPAEAADRAEVVFNRANAAEPESLDPARSETVTSSRIQSDLFEGLVTLDPEDRVRPAAAERWEVSPDGLTYTFHLRDGLVWSDGSPLLAGDFVYSFRRVVDPQIASSYAYMLFPIENAEAIADGKIKDLSRLGVAAPDERTVVIRLGHPTPYLLSLVAHAKFLPVKQSDVETYGTGFTQPGHLVSNGPFTLAEWTPQARIVVVKNPKYWDAANVHIDKVVFYPISSQNEEFTRYRAGELDATYGVPHAAISFIKSRLPDELRSQPQFEAHYYGFNLTRPPFADNPKLRRALSLVVDREALVEKLMRDGSPAAYGIVPAFGDPTYHAARLSWSGLSMEERIAEAKRLYAEVGYGPDHPLTVELRGQTDEDSRKVAIAIASMWQKALGVRASIVGEEFKMLVAHRQEKQVTQVFHDAWVADYPDATTFLEMFLTGAGQNNPGYADPRYDALLAEAGQTRDVAKRAELLAEAEQLFLDADAIIPLFNRAELYLVKPYVKGYRPSPCGYTYSKDVTILPH